MTAHQKRLSPQPYRKGATLPHKALYPDAPTVGTHDLLHNAQPQACARHVPRFGTASHLHQYTTLPYGRFDGAAGS